MLNKGRVNRRVGTGRHEDFDRLVVVVADRALEEARGHLHIRRRLAILKRHGKFPVLRLPFLDGVRSTARLAWYEAMFLLPYLLPQPLCVGII
jgi:hypothetical protein